MSLESKSHSEVVGPARDSARFNYLLFIPLVALQCGLEFSTQFCHLYFFGNRFGLRIGVRTSDRRCRTFGVSGVGSYKGTTMLLFYLRDRNAQDEQTHSDKQPRARQVGGA